MMGISFSLLPNKYSSRGWPHKSKFDPRLFAICYGAYGFFFIVFTVGTSGTAVHVPSGRGAEHHVRMHGPERVRPAGAVLAAMYQHQGRLFLFLRTRLRTGNGQAHVQSAE